MTQFFSLLKTYTKPLLISMYIAGLIGYLTPISVWFRYLTAFNLVLSMVLVLLHEENLNRKVFLFGIFTYLYGFIVEWLGVKTGLIFGTYFYGATLGWKLDGIPLVIGVNWFLMLLLSDGITHYVTDGRFSFQSNITNALVHASLGATFMVLLDFLIEPVAIHFDFWHWEKEVVPLQNYLAWWVCGFFLHFLGKIWQPSKQNPIAVFLYVIQFLFFLLLNFFQT